MDIPWRCNPHGSITRSSPQRCRDKTRRPDRTRNSNPSLVDIIRIGKVPTQTNSSDNRFSSIGNGFPSSIHDSDSDTALPSDNILSLNEMIPLGYFGASVALAQITGHVFQAMYSVPPPGGGNGRSRHTVADLYGELVRWCHEIHPDLRIPSKAADEVNSVVLRRLSFLNLRFQFATMSVTRPLLFKLVMALRDGTFASLPPETQV